jgi:soluble P-type ATPase
MLGKAALSVAVLGDEGLSTAALGAAQIVVKDIRDGLDLLLKTDRLRATLRF